MTITDEQRRAAKDGGTVRFVDPETQTEYVLVRADIFDRATALDDSPLTDEQMAILAWEAGKSIGWDTPEMAEYDDCDAHRKQP